MKPAKLGINIDHVATLRQARGEEYPDLTKAAILALENGADQITIHLREDRRHIQDKDLAVIKVVTDQFEKPLNLELGVDPEIVNLAIHLAPEWICIVPEKREERTTEGGLNLIDQKQYQKIEASIAKIRSEATQTKISLFVEANIQTLEKALELKVDAVEIHTGDYAMAFNKKQDLTQYYKQFDEAYDFCNEHKINFHAGHGLIDLSLKDLIDRGQFIEYNIGHWVISESIYKGLGQVVKELKNIIQGA